MAGYTINNPGTTSSGQVNQNQNGLVELDTHSVPGVVYYQGTIQPGAKTISFYNNGLNDGSDTGSDAHVGVPGNMITVPFGVAKNYPCIPGPGGTYPEVDWLAGGENEGNQLLITVVY